MYLLISFLKSTFIEKAIITNYEQFHALFCVVYVAKMRNYNWSSLKSNNEHLIQNKIMQTLSKQSNNEKRLELITMMRSKFDINTSKQSISKL